MRPILELEDLKKAVKTFEENQISKILGIKGDTQILKDFLNIPDTIFTEEQLATINKTMEYIDKQSNLYKEIRNRYDYHFKITRFINGLSDWLRRNGIEENAIQELTDNQNFEDVVTSAILGQFANSGRDVPRFNTNDFNSAIQKGASAELAQIIKRLFWAESKKTEGLDINIEPVGATGAAQDIILKFTMTGPRGGKQTATLREDVKSSLEANYLGSTKIYGELKKIIERAAEKMVKNGKNIYIQVNSIELENVVAKILGEKYGMVYNQGKWVANTAIFFTSPDGNIKLGSEILQEENFEIEVNNTITKIAIRHGYLGNWNNTGGK